MSVEQMAQVWKLDLAPNKRLVLLAYADHADEYGNHVFPSLARIAHKTGYSRDQVRRISKDLRGDELMELVEAATHNRPAEYRLTLHRGSILQPLNPWGGGANDPPQVGAPMPPEPSVQPPYSPRGADAPEKDKEEPPAKAMTTMTIDRARLRGFYPSAGQIANWGKGWSDFIYVGEDETPPSADEQLDVLDTIVDAAAGKLGKTRFFLSVPDAVQRVRGNVTDIKSRRPEKKPDRITYGPDGEKYVNGVEEA